MMNIELVSNIEKYKPKRGTSSIGGMQSPILAHEALYITETICKESIKCNSYLIWYESIKPWLVNNFNCKIKHDKDNSFYTIKKKDLITIDEKLLLSLSSEFIQISESPSPKHDALISVRAFIPLYLMYEISIGTSLSILKLNEKRLRMNRPISVYKSIISNSTVSEAYINAIDRYGKACNELYKSLRVMNRLDIDGLYFMPCSSITSTIITGYKSDWVLMFNYYLGLSCKSAEIKVMISQMKSYFNNMNLI